MRKAATALPGDGGPAAGRVRKAATALPGDGGKGEGRGYRGKNAGCELWLCKAALHHQGQAASHPD